MNAQAPVDLEPFLSQVRDPKRAFISPSAVSEALHMSLDEVAKLAKIHRNTLTRMPGSPKVQERLGTIVRIISIAATLAGDLNKAILWFRHQPLTGFRNRTAQSLVEDDRADLVLMHLEMLEDGVYA
jgi:uncharacterized protein (DUF2384 family)